jgi:hypothetical protein
VITCRFGAAPHVSTPPKQLLRRQPMPSGNRADRRTGLAALSNDLRLLFCRAAPAPTRTGEHFQAPRRLRFKQKLSVRHVSNGLEPPSDNRRTAEKIEGGVKAPLTLKQYFICGDFLFVHAGVRPRICLTKQSEDDLS